MLAEFCIKIRDEITSQIPLKFQISNIEIVFIFVLFNTYYLFHQICANKSVKDKIVLSFEASFGRQFFKFFNNGLYTYIIF